MILVGVMMYTVHIGMEYILMVPDITSKFPVLYAYQCDLGKGCQCKFALYI